MYIDNIDHFVHAEKVEDTNEVTRSHKSKDRQHHGQMKKDKQRSKKTLHRKLKIEQHELHVKLGVNSGAPDKYACPHPHVTR